MAATNRTRDFARGLGEELPRVHPGINTVVGHRVKYGSGNHANTEYWPEPSEWETGDNPVVAAVLRATEHPISEMKLWVASAEDGGAWDFPPPDRNRNARALYSWVNRTLKERTEI
jgi:hypothetical protein